MDILFVLVGLAAGIAIGFLLGRNRKADSSNESTAELTHLQSELENLKDAKIAVETSNARLEERFNGAVENYKKQKADIGKLNQRIEDLINENIQLNGSLVEFRTTNDQLEKQKKELEAVKEKFNKEFESIAGKLLKSNTAELSETNKSRLSEVLQPFQKQIDKFEKQVQDAFVKEGKDKVELKTELKELMRLNQKLSSDAENLTKALKGDSKKQGDWGEVILERILERSGLSKGQEYENQYSTQNADGQTIRPDVLVKLPDDKHVIIDSKVSLTAYEQFINAEEQTERDIALKAHLNSVRKHVSDLSAKNYQTGVGVDSPDFVLMFMPIESAFSLAVQNDIDLFNHAWEKRIVVVSPTTLLATLRTIASIWKQERQTQNVQEIARLGGDIHDKLIRTMDEFVKLDEDFGKMHEKFNVAQKRLFSGRGNVINTALKMQDLGAKTKLTPSAKLIDKIEDTE